MTAANPSPPGRSAPDWDALRSRLDAERRRVLERIHAYPPPITACDAQFEHLLERSSALARALRRLDALAREGSADEAAHAALAALLPGAGGPEDASGAAARPGADD